MQNLSIMERVARQAGELLRGAKATGQTQKSNSKDFVTAADIRSQDLIRSQLLQAFPDVPVLSEEDSEAERQALYAADFTGFVLDPIDGTYNFKRDMKESAVSIGYIEAGESVAGVIYDPYRDELFAAEKGQGATCNGRPIHVSEQSELQSASVAFSNSYDDAAMVRTLQRHLAIHERTGVMPWTSCPGSGVLVMAWIACGRIDAYHHNGIKPWDNAAAFVIAREAGAMIQDLAGMETSFTTSTLVIGTPAIVTQLQDVFSGLPADLRT